MKKNILFWTLSVAASLILSTGLIAQEQTEVSIKVTKDGKVIKDTTYQFDDASEAKHAVMMMEVLSGEDGDDQHKKVIVMKSEDGNTFDILGDEDYEGGDVVKKKEIKVIVSGDEEGNWTVVEGDEKMLMKEGDDGENVKVIV
ncbi:MAG: hypothetical protein U9R60_10565, partial [Bacteroidota bacterium]|nr:hypothetical protein [Bacteroidota bacterium]